MCIVLCLGSGYFTFQFYCHYFPKLKTDYIHCFSVGVIDYPNKKQFREEKDLFWLTVSKGIPSIMKGKVWKQKPEGQPGSQQAE